MTGLWVAEMVVVWRKHGLVSKCCCSTQRVSGLEGCLGCTPIVLIFAMVTDVVVGVELERSLTGTVLCISPDPVIKRVWDKSNLLEGVGVRGKVEAWWCHWTWVSGRRLAYKAVGFREEWGVMRCDWDEGRERCAKMLKKMRGHFLWQVHDVH